MKVRKKGYWVLFMFTLFFAILAVLTLIPSEGASKECMLGYKAFCTFTPVSTVICAIPAGLICFIRKRFFVSYK